MRTLLILLCLATPAMAAPPVRPVFEFRYYPPGQGGRYVTYYPYQRYKSAVDKTPAYSGAGKYPVR